MKRDALVLVIGDFFDAMQGPRDPRGTPADVDPAHLTPAYFNGIVSDAASFLAPYARNIALLSKGNHEISVIKHYGVSLLDMLARELTRVEPSSPVQIGGYEGWVRIMVRIYTVRTQLKWYYHHGAGAGAMMSFGTLNIRRKASYLPDCDAYISGHTHDQYVLPIARLRLSNQGIQHRDVMWAVRTPGFKDERSADSWAVQKDLPPKPIGGVWGIVTATARSVRTTFVADVV